MLCVCLVSVHLRPQLAILGGPLRLFEMLGLQQPWRSHALITALYLVCHPLFAATGIRCVIMCDVLCVAGKWTERA